MKRTLVLSLLVLTLLLLAVETGFAAKKKQVVNISAIYEIDTWVGTTFELFLKEYKLKMPKKIDLTLANSATEFYSLAKVKAELGAITIEGVIILSSERVDNTNRVPLLRELMRVTLIENKKGKDADKIIDEFFKKYKIK